MRRIVHAHRITCDCRTCSPRLAPSWRTELILRGATRALLLVAALVSLPFIIAHALACARGDNR